jgi:hypothetical protein
MGRCGGRLPGFILFPRRQRKAEQLDKSCGSAVGKRMEQITVRSGQRDWVVTLYVGTCWSLCSLRGANGGTMMPPMDLGPNIERHEILFRRPLLKKIRAAAIPPRS